MFSKRYTVASVASFQKHIPIHQRETSVHEVLCVTDSGLTYYKIKPSKIGPHDELVNGKSISVKKINSEKQPDKYVVQMKLVQCSVHLYMILNV